MLLNRSANKKHAILSWVFPRKLLTSLLSAVVIVCLLVPALPVPVLAAAGPELIEPADNVTITATGENGTLPAPPMAMPIFSWEPVVGAKSYTIEFGDDINFTSPNISFPTDLTHFTPTDISRFPDGKWYWHVQVTSWVTPPTTPPQPSDWSVRREFIKDWASPENKPDLIHPAESDTLEFYDSPVFSWSPVIGAASYEFQYSTSPEFTSFIRSPHIVFSTTYQPNVELANGNYYWRIVPYNPANAEGTPSAVGSFSMSYNQVPELIEPADGSTPSFTPVFRWRAVRGAREYRFQISTDPTFTTGIVVSTTTKNTTYTLTNTLDNDKNYYWRVQSFNGASYSAWSHEGDPWYFIKRWYIQPVLLSPIASFPYVRIPFFSWTPVPGAARYKVEMSLTSDFVNPKISEYTSNTFYTPIQYDWTPAIRYWRVTPFDGSTKPGKPSNTGQFSSYEFNYSPDLVAPLYYYVPNNYPDPDTEVEMHPYEDRSVAYPLFTWQRLFDPEDGEIFPNAYRVQVGTGMNPDGTVSGMVWQTDTENLSAAPKLGEFDPVPGTIYYWQVTPLDGIGGNIMVKPPIIVDEDTVIPREGTFSQVWKTRFDPAKKLPETGGPVPQLLRPFYSSTYDPAINPGYDSAEFVEITPALEWFPVLNADQYEVQLSRSTNFSSPVDSAYVSYPVYAPRVAFGQRSLGNYGYGSYYWRVRARVNSVWGNWSDPWRFQIASQSAWQGSRTLGSTDNRLEIARDPSSGEVASDYDITGLYATQDKDYWYFGFNYFGSGNSTYVLYLDVDNRENSGATFDRSGYLISANIAHRPEYAIYLNKSGGNFTAQGTIIYQWTGSDWDTGRSLSYVLGALYKESNFVEIKVPYDPIGMQLSTGTYSLALVSVDPVQKKTMDTVPPNTIDTDGATTLEFITTVSEHMTLSSPANDLAGDPAKFPSIPPFFMNYPPGAPWAGYAEEVYLDAQFTSEKWTSNTTSTGPYYSSPTNAWASDFKGDNTYYWRARPRYLMGTTPVFGSWSQAWRIEREGFIPENLQVSVTQATPTFSWDRVEGAAKYVLWYSTDRTFFSKNEVITTENVYTPTGTLADAKYYWKVAARRNNNETSYWSDMYAPLNEFSLALPAPTGLSANGQGTDAVVDRAPTLCWDVLSVNNNAGEPVLFAAKYRVQVRKGDPNATSVWDTIDTQQNCWTPIKGYADGEYYWKVAMLDGADRIGMYSPSASFIKQYPMAKPKSPVSGSVEEKTPTFRWTADDGVTPYVFGAASYEIQISTFENYYQPLTATTNSTDYTPTTKLPTKVPLYWRVRIKDKAGNYGPYTNALVIIDDKPYVVYLPFTRK